jgi:hypothetical protein
MDLTFIPRDWFEKEFKRRNKDRSFLGFDDRMTVTERYRLKDLFNAVDARLSDFENQMRILEETDADKKKSPGSQEMDLMSSFETLVFWRKMLEKRLAIYSRKIAIETEFGPRVRIIKKRMKILVIKNSATSK